jgi:hypothetical protein
MKRTNLILCPQLRWCGPRRGARFAVTPDSPPQTGRRITTSVIVRKRTKTVKTVGDWEGCETGISRKIELSQRWGQYCQFGLSWQNRHEFWNVLNNLTSLHRIQALPFRVIEEGHPISQDFRIKWRAKRRENDDYFWQVLLKRWLFFHDSSLVRGWPPIIFDSNSITDGRFRHSLNRKWSAVYIHQNKSWLLLLLEFQWSFALIVRERIHDFPEDRIWKLIEVNRVYGETFEQLGWVSSIFRFDRHIPILLEAT